jgi:hypothetical protein
VARVLLIAGDDDVCRRVFARERRAHWAAAFDIVLEKHGYLDVERAGPEALADPATFERDGAVLVARLPGDHWPAERAAAAARGHAQVLVEGPPPPTLLAELGVTAAGPLPSNCVVVVRDPALRAAGAARGSNVTARLAPASAAPVDLDDDQHWPRLGAPITPGQAEAWRAPGWDAERWRLEDRDAPSVLATIAPQDDRRDASPAIVRRGSLVGCSFGLLAYLAQAHTSEPVEGAEWRSSSRTLTLEHLVTALVDDMLARAGVPRLRVLPWPGGARWALNVRHDVDRPPAVADIEATLARHRRAGTRATWYWRARHLPQTAAALRAAAAGHEIALHTERLWTDAAAADLAVVERTAGPVRGSSAHGDRTCARYQGAPNVLWAHAHGLRYTELVQHSHLHPHRFLTLEPDGAVRPLDIVCLPHHESLDSGTAPGRHRADLILERARLYAQAGGLLQVLNHPDIHQEALSHVLEAIPRDDRLDWTAGEVADWWLRTHVRGAASADV